MEQPLATLVGNAEKLSADALKKKGKGALIDFSSPAGTREAAICAVEANWALVVGTTGLDETAQNAINAASAKIPVVVSSNMIPLLRSLLSKELATGL